MAKRNAGNELLLTRQLGNILFTAKWHLTESRLFMLLAADLHSSFWFVAYSLNINLRVKLFL